MMADDFEQMADDHNDPLPLDSQWHLTASVNFERWQKAQSRVSELENQLATAQASADYWHRKALAGEQLAGGVSMALELFNKPSSPFVKGLTAALADFNKITR